MNILGVIILIAVIIGVWASYRLFMRGHTPEEKVAALMPPGFKPDVFYRKGDTYVGYENAKDQLVLVDWPHRKVVASKDVGALEPVQETMLGVTHFWLAIDVPDAAFPRYRIWFQFRRARRDAWLDRLRKITKN